MKSSILNRLEIKPSPVLFLFHSKFKIQNYAPRLLSTARLAFALGVFTLAGSPCRAATYSWTGTGTGTLTLSAANTYSGGTVINGGTVSCNADDASLGAANGGITFNGSATILFPRYSSNFQTTLSAPPTLSPA